jgi:nucleoside triphosphate diphosphatase
MEEDASSMPYLLAIMARLRDPETGCAWDLKQNLQSLAPYLLEEAYEVADAITRNDRIDLQEELGDVLLQVVFQARIAEEEGHFTFEDVTRGICDKLIRRHPHIFGEQQNLSAVDVARQWDAIKLQEKEQKRQARLTAGLPDKPDAHFLSSVPNNLPALLRAEALTKKAATIGFDWNNISDVLDKVDEEIAELRVALASQDQAAIEDEMGDCLFALINAARHAKVNAETALRGTNEKFIQRFAYVETALKAQGRNLEQASLEEMEALWQQAKQPQSS